MLLQQHTYLHGHLSHDKIDNTSKVYHGSLLLVCQVYDTIFYYFSAHSLGNQPGNGGLSWLRLRITVLDFGAALTMEGTEFDQGDRAHHITSSIYRVSEFPQFRTGCAVQSSEFRLDSTCAEWIPVHILVSIILYCCRTCRWTSHKDLRLCGPVVKLCRKPWRVCRLILLPFLHVHTCTCTCGKCTYVYMYMNYIHAHTTHHCMCVVCG